MKWLILLLFFMPVNKDEEIYYSEVRQIINHINSMDSCGWVRKDKLIERLKTTDKYYYLEKKKILREEGKM